MSRTLIFALTLGMATAEEAYEWKGVFYTPENKYMWGAQKVSGKYVDPTMKLVAIPVAGATAEALAGASGMGTQSMGLSCESVNSGGTIVPMENKCYKLVFDQTSSQSLYTIDASSAGAIAFFAEHLPTEFEATEHYLKDTSGLDIEPVAQEPDGEGHDHGPGPGGDCVPPGEEPPEPGPDGKVPPTCDEYDGREGHDHGPGPGGDCV